MDDTGVGNCNFLYDVRVKFFLGSVTERISMEKIKEGRVNMTKMNKAIIFVLLFSCNF